jgi:putative membrane protein
VNSAPASRYPLILLTLFALWWLALAIAPAYRQDWLLENVLVFVSVPLLVFGYRRLRFSNVAYTCLFVFFVLHEIGAHYNYAEVPYERWSMALTGHGLNEALGFARNHYDRLVHFLYGVLITPAVIELLDARAPQQGLWRWVVPWFFMAGHGVVFEMVEATAAGVFGGDLGQAYLGTQGDVWDAQKDSALAALGAAFTLIVLRMRRRA